MFFFSSMAAVGKTSLITRFMYDSFDNTYQVRLRARASLCGSVQNLVSLCISLLVSINTTSRLFASAYSHKIKKLAAALLLSKSKEKKKVWGRKSTLTE